MCPITAYIHTNDTCPPENEATLWQASHRIRLELQIGVPVFAHLTLLSCRSRLQLLNAAGFSAIGTPRTLRRAGGVGIPPCELLGVRASGCTTVSRPCCVSSGRRQAQRLGPGGCLLHTIPSSESLQDSVIGSMASSHPVE